MNSTNRIDRDRKSLAATRSSSLDFYLENYIKYGDDVKQKKVILVFKNSKIQKCRKIFVQIYTIHNKQAMHPNDF